MRHPYYFSLSPSILSIGTLVQVEAVAAGGNNLCQLLQSIYSLGTVVSTCADRELTSTPSAFLMEREAE